MTRSVEIPEAAVEAAAAVIFERAHSDKWTYRETAFASLAAALPYLAPAGDGGLREALEKALESPVELWHENSFRVRALPETMLRELLAAHPAAPAVPQPAEERPLRTALERYFSNGGPDTPIRTTWHDGVEHWEAPAEDIRELIEGSAVPQPVDREALAKAIHDSACGCDHYGHMVEIDDHEAADIAMAVLADSEVKS